MTKLFGITLCKNLNKYDFPLEMNLLQHKDLFDHRIFIVPREDQDLDQTAKTIVDICAQNNISSELFRVDWPTEKGFQEESIDKTLQQKAIQYIEEKYWDDEDNDVWVIKHDADEFIHEKDFGTIHEYIENFNNTDITLVGFNYRQFLGSLEYTVSDPTTCTYHLYKVGYAAKFPGNDAMNVETMGDSVYIEDIYINHIGYVKNKQQLTTKIQEHFILNESVYSDIDGEKLSQFQFEFPLHKQGASMLWPLAFAVIYGRKNETEYIKIPDEELPKQFILNKNKYKFYMPGMS